MSSLDEGDFRITVTKSASFFVPVTEDHGGCQGGACMLCGSSGWLDPRLGRDADDPEIATSSVAGIVHKRDCPIGRELAQRRRAGSAHGPTSIRQRSRTATFPETPL